MIYRTKAILFFILLTLAILSASCGFNQQSRFQNSFLPSAPYSTPPDLEPAPVVASQPNVFLKDIPTFLIVPPTPPERKTKGDLTAQQADLIFQHAKRL